MSKPVRQFRLGFIVNPLAGVGGPTAKKGSDDPQIQSSAWAGELPLSSPTRARTFLEHLSVPPDCQLTLVTVRGAMGADAAWGLPWAVELVGFTPSERTTALDTQNAVQALVARQVDLLIFVGGDGTARDVCAVVPPRQPVLGVPAGVKMHSGVYAINPQMAAELVSLLLQGDLVNLAMREVRDIDEDAFRGGVVKSRHFGDMLTPEEGRFVQHVKQGGLEVEDLVLLDIADHLREEVGDESTLVIWGPGSTTLNVMRNLGLEGTLLGVDAVLDGAVIARDVDAKALADHLHKHSGPVLLIVTAIGGQGHIIGRGNQQLSPEVLRRVGRDNLRVIATKTKLKTLDGRPLQMDSGDKELDLSWQGYIPVITGFKDTVLYPLGVHATLEKSHS